MDSPNQRCCRFSKENYFVPNHLFEKCAEFISKMRLLIEVRLLFEGGSYYSIYGRSEDFSPKVLTDPFVLQVGKPRLRVCICNE